MFKVFDPIREDSVMTKSSMFPGDLNSLLS